MPSNLHSGKLRNVEIFQTETKGPITEVFYAETAHWSKEAKSWSLRNGMRISFGNSSEKIKQEPFNDLNLNNWRETPWKIYTDSLIPDQLGIINLIYHLKRNPEKTQKTMAPFKTHLHYRWALPLSCIAIALMDTSFSPSSKLKTPAATRAENSPRECPATFFGLKESPNIFKIAIE